MNKDCQVNAVSDREEKIFFACIGCLGHALMVSEAAQLLNPVASATTSANQAA